MLTKKEKLQRKIKLLDDKIDQLEKRRENCFKSIDQIESIEELERGYNGNIKNNYNTN
jgi:prefoldin subunit 5